MASSGFVPALVCAVLASVCTSPSVPRHPPAPRQYPRPERRGSAAGRWAAGPGRSRAWVSTPGRSCGRAGCPVRERPPPAAGAARDQTEPRLFRSGAPAEGRVGAAFSIFRTPSRFSCGRPRTRVRLDRCRQAVGPHARPGPLQVGDAVDAFVHVRGFSQLCVNARANVPLSRTPGVRAGTATHPTPHPPEGSSSTSLTQGGLIQASPPPESACRSFTGVIPRPPVVLALLLPSREAEASGSQRCPLCRRRRCP